MSSASLSSIHVLKAPSMLCSSWQHSDVGLGKETYKHIDFHFSPKSCPFSRSNWCPLVGSWCKSGCAIQGPQHLHPLPAFFSGTSPKAALQQAALLINTGSRASPAASATKFFDTDPISAIPEQQAIEQGKNRRPSELQALCMSIYSMLCIDLLSW